MKINLKKTAGVILSVSMAVMPLTVSAGIPVTNPAQLAQDATNFVKQMGEYRKQLMEMKKQYEQQRKQFKSMTGSRNLGNILKDAVKDQVPSEWSTIYKGAKDIDYKSVINSKGYDAKFSDRMTVQNQKEMEKVFDSMKEQLASLDAMMDKIDQTQDMKAAADLQNRIAVEQAKIANNQTKLDMLDRLYVRQQELNKRNYAAREACMAKHMASGNYAACK